MRMYKKIIVLAVMLIEMTGWARDSAPFLLDTTDLLVETGGEVSFNYNSSWIGDDSSAEVVISADGTEIMRTTGEGEFAWSPTTVGKHTLTYTTYINGVAQEEVYTATVFKDWKYTVDNGEATIIETTQTSGDVVIPSEIDGLPVVGLDEGLFNGCEGITSIVIPDSVYSIGANAFANCMGLTNVSMPLLLKGQIEAGDIFAGCSENLEIVYRSAEIANVVAKQRFPWNGKVDITYNVTGNIAAGLPEWSRPVLMLSALDRTTGSNYEAQVSELSGDTGIEEGEHHIVWDFNAQNLQVKSDDMVFTITYSKRSTEAVAGAERAGEILYFVSAASTKIDSRIEPLVDSIYVSYNSAWIGGEESAEVVIEVNGAEIKRTTGEGEFVWSPITAGKHILTYTTYIDGVAQEEVYTATVFKDWKYTVEDGKATIVETTQKSGSVTIPSEIDGCPVVGFVDGLFDGCTNLTQVVIPGNCVAKMSDIFPDSYDKLTSVTLTGDVTEIPQDAFAGCVALESFVIPDAVKKIDANAFSGCSSLSEIVIPDSVYSMGVNAFLNCTGLKKVSMPFPLKAQVESGNVFDGCLENLEIVYRTAEIKNVVAKQRFPWNGKVDIKFEVEGNVNAGISSENPAELTVSAKDSMTGEEWIAKTFTGDTGTDEGGHHVVWDMKADGLSFYSQNIKFKVGYFTKPRKYCVIDLSGGKDATAYPVSYLADVPEGGWTDEYKTSKLVLRLIEPGSFKMGGSYDVTLTKPYYMGVFEVTQKQYELVTGSKPSMRSGNTLPVEQVSWNMIRGDSATHNWPTVKTVDSNSFVGRLQARTGLSFDLPTEAQWEYACRAGTTTIYYWGDSMDGAYAWYSSNSSSTTHVVGTRTPNAWGLYDMSGNAWEWCLDWRGDLVSAEDPKGASSGSARVLRSGSWYDSASSLTSSWRSSWISPSTGKENTGFRLTLHLGE